MPRKSKLLTALEAHKGRDYKLEKQRKLQKQAEKKKRKRHVAEVSDGQISAGSDSEGWQGVESGSNKSDEEYTRGDCNGLRQDQSPQPTIGEIVNGHQAEDSRSRDARPNHTGAGDAGPAGDEDEEQQDEQEEAVDEADIPFSDIDSLASSDKCDIVPFQRLTINNTTALLSAHRSIALPPSLPFSAYQTLTTSEPVHVADINDDLTRELAFYKQCLEAAERGRQLLKDEDVPFSRPSDYFAEMVKSDEHMGKIKQKMVDDAASKKASSEAKRQRDLRKFGKQVQVAKERERAKAKRAMLDKIDLLKRKRKNADIGAANEDDMFDVALDDAANVTRGDHAGNRGKSSARPTKRQKRNSKFGFGGKKRFAKSGDALSSGDVSGASAKRMKNDRGKQKRLGKSRRAKKS